MLKNFTILSFAAAVAAQRSNDSIEGCTDSSAANWNPIADVDDGSCYGNSDDYAAESNANIDFLLDCFDVSNEQDLYDLYNEDSEAFFDQYVECFYNDYGEDLQLQGGLDYACFGVNNLEEFDALYYADPEAYYALFDTCMSLSNDLEEYSEYESEGGYGYDYACFGVTDLDGLYDLYNEDSEAFFDKYMECIYNSYEEDLQLQSYESSEDYEGDYGLDYACFGVNNFEELYDLYESDAEAFYDLYNDCAVSYDISYDYDCFGVSNQEELEALYYSDAEAFFNLFYECVEYSYLQEDNCWTDVGAEICILGEGELSVCPEQLDECWLGEYDAYGFMVGDDEMRGIICDWEGECVGNHAEDDNDVYSHDFFLVTEGNVVYPIQIDWIEDIAVDSIHAYIAGMCEWNEELSSQYEATVVACQYGDDAWYAGYNDEGFGAADEGRMLICSWEGDCVGNNTEATFCSASWEEIECDE